jgi:PIN domain nuclease of toxin-antitoxin system
MRLNDVPIGYSYLDLVIRMSGKTLQIPGIEMLRTDSEIAWESCHLPGVFHRDPADQLIVATARICGLTLITCDEKIPEYSGVKTICG